MTHVLQAEGLDKSYGSLRVLDGVSFAVEEGESLALLGPSGCGKSTLFRLLLGLEPHDSGRVVRNFSYPGYLPQGGLLFPWKTLLQNAELPLELKGVPRRKRRETVFRRLEPFGLQGFANYYPGQLSGGMRQRAALLRTVLAGAEVLFLDEPFGALDMMTRMRLQDWILPLLDEIGRTILLITHDPEEALLLCGRILLLSERPASVRGHVESQAEESGSKSRTGRQFFQAKARLLEIISE